MQRKVCGLANIPILVQHFLISVELALEMIQEEFSHQTVVADVPHHKSQQDFLNPPRLMEKARMTTLALLRYNGKEIPTKKESSV